MRKFRQPVEIMQKTNFSRKIQNSLKQMQSFSEKVHQKTIFWEYKKDSFSKRDLSASPIDGLTYACIVDGQTET